MRFAKGLTTQMETSYSFISCSSDLDKQFTCGRMLSSATGKHRISQEVRHHRRFFYTWIVCSFPYMNAFLSTVARKAKDMVERAKTRKILIFYPLKEVGRAYKCTHCTFVCRIFVALSYPECYDRYRESVWSIPTV